MPTSDSTKRNPPGTPRAALPPFRQWRLRTMVLCAIAFALLVGADQATKSWIEHSFRMNESINVVPGLFDITHVRNEGAAFGLLRGTPASVRVPFFLGVSLLAVVALGYLAFRSQPQQRLFRGSLILLASGAVGNLIDRVRLGEVVDFLLVYHGNWTWPAFNVADSLISVGVVLLLIDAFKGAPAPAAQVDGEKSGLTASADLRS